MSNTTMRKFSTSYKESAVLRLLAGESLAALAAELNIRRKLLYQWRDAHRDHGVAGFNRKRGVKPGTPRKSRNLPGNLSPPPDPGPDASPAEALAHARARIAELERKVGRQQMDLDFFQRALRLVEPAAPSPGGTTPTRSSTP